MRKIKELQTGKCKLLAVMVPEGASDFCIPPDIYLEPTLQWWIAVNGIVDEVGSIDLPEGNWQILGLATELTEEEWRMFVPQLGGKLFDGDLNNYYSYPDFLTMDHPFDNKLFSTAKESGLSLLEANQIYSVNPYGEKPTDEFQDGKYLRRLGKWQEAEANTCPYLILKQL